MGPEAALAIHAKRNGGQAIENKRSREMARFRIVMTPMAYDRRAKRFISLCEMTPVDFIGPSPRQGPKRKAGENDGRFRARAAEAARDLRCYAAFAARKRRRKRLESLKMDSE